MKDETISHFERELTSAGWTPEGVRFLIERAGDPLMGRAIMKLAGKPYRFSRSPLTRKIPIPPDIRWVVWERDNFTCKRCGIRKHLSVDHIIPESKGGTLDMGNLQTLCRGCNSSKGAR